MKERREHPRTPFTALVTFLIAGSDTPQLCKGIDLSVGGARMRTWGNQPPLGELVECDLIVDQRTRLQVDGEVVRRDDDGEHFAIRFVNLSPALKSRIVELVDRALSAAGSEQLDPLRERTETPLIASYQLHDLLGRMDRVSGPTRRSAPDDAAFRAAIPTIPPDAPSVIDTSLPPGAFRLLCEVDGRLTCAQLAARSPTGATDALRLLRELVDLGFLSLGGTT